ncbi:MAG TPA: STAS domain-containing protein [Aggregatilineaceae bacterium]|nr:STAS domain-containing protein [Aggregatilineaceae bacterium]
MNIAVQTQQEITMVELTGRWDSNSASEVENLILPLVQPSSCILLDLSAVTYLSSAGLRSLLLIYRRIRDYACPIVLVGLSESLKDVMSITGFLPHFRVYDTAAEGLAALKAENE